MSCNLKLKSLLHDQYVRSNVMGNIEVEGGHKISMWVGDRKQ